MKERKDWNGMVQRLKPMLGCSVRRKRKYAVILTVPMTIVNIFISGFPCLSQYYFNIILYLHELESLRN